MLRIRQNYPPSPALNFRSAIEDRLAEAGVTSRIRPGMKIAVGVGSRGISNLKEIVAAVLAILRDAQAEPFIVPAMGSHGGATAEGQQKVLSVYGITPETMGVPFETSMDVRPVGTTKSGTEVLVSEAALKADGILLINRVKPHTDFSGNLGSGILKMMVIGLGKHKGAAAAHASAAHIGHERVFRESAEVIARKTPFLAGVAILENQHHETAEIHVVDGKHLALEDELLVKARKLMPLLPFSEIDLLIVDQIGKEISGAGMDPNVIGRSVNGYISTLRPEGSFQPNIYRIFLRDLTAATNGNGVGIGLADFTTTRAVHALNLRYTYVNGLTSLGLQTVKIPIYFDNDLEVLQHAIPSLALAPSHSPRIVRISNTLNLEEMLVSESLGSEVRKQKSLSILGEAAEMIFDADGNLEPLPGSYPNASQTELTATTA
jgi:hypothetical protein